MPEDHGSVEPPGCEPPRWTSPTRGEGARGPTGMASWSRGPRAGGAGAAWVRPLRRFHVAGTLLSVSASDAPPSRRSDACLHPGRLCGLAGARSAGRQLDVARRAAAARASPLRQARRGDRERAVWARSRACGARRSRRRRPRRRSWTRGGGDGHGGAAGRVVRRPRGSGAAAPTGLVRSRRRPRARHGRRRRERGLVRSRGVPDGRRGAGRLGGGVPRVLRSARARGGVVRRGPHGGAPAVERRRVRRLRAGR